MLPAREDIENDRLRQRNGYTKAALKDLEEDQRLKDPATPHKKVEMQDPACETNMTLRQVESSGKPAGHRSPRPSPVY